MISNKIEIPILFQDDYYIIVDKPAHLLVHKTPGDKDTTNLLKLVRNQIHQYLYPIHRLDKQVSGCIVFGLQPDAVIKIQENWNSSLVRKKYLALVKGEFQSPGQINFALNDHNKRPKEAMTIYHPLKSFKDCTLLEIEIKTGRYHQIRRHFSRRMQHVIGDRKYGKKIVNDYFLKHHQLSRLFLHSYSLEFQHPFTKELIQTNAALPTELQKVIDSLG